jgi:hypothetical protein
MNVGAAWELVDFFQPTTQPTKPMSYMTSAYFGSPRGLVSCPLGPSARETP